jgi:hypothetical protein
MSRCVHDGGCLPPVVTAPASGVDVADAGARGRKRQSVSETRSLKSAVITSTTLNGDPCSVLAPHEYP